MKRISISGTEYDLYAAGENPAVSIYPHMVEVSTGQIPRGRQLGLLKAFLKANGVTPIAGANTHWCVEAAMKVGRGAAAGPLSVSEADASLPAPPLGEPSVACGRDATSSVVGFDRAARAEREGRARIALISCSKLKKPYPCEAKELYSASRLFSLSYAYARERADRIYILSAKYGLVGEDEIIAPYDETLKKKSVAERQAWARKVTDQLRQVCDIREDTFVILAGQDYYEYLLPQLKHAELPLGRLKFGPRLAFLQRELRGTAAAETRPFGPTPHHSAKLTASPPGEAFEGEPSAAAGWVHRVFWQLPVYDWRSIDRIPFQDGIYIVFEEGERYGDGPRIVRVGTHTSPRRLKERLKDHFVRENHNGSIFRKNIGKAMLNRDGDPYLPIWTLDTSKAPHRGKEDRIREAEIENRVSAFLRERFRFCVFPVPDREERLRMEEAIIATLNRSEDFRASEGWLGNSSPEREIRESGMWLKQGLDAKPLTDAERVRLKELTGVGETG